MLGTVEGRCSSPRCLIALPPHRASSALLQELTGGQGGEGEGQQLALPGLGGDQEEDDGDLEHELDAVLQGDAVMGKYTKVWSLVFLHCGRFPSLPCGCPLHALPLQRWALCMLGEGSAVGGRASVQRNGSGGLFLCGWTFLR